jgi:ATP-dependent DNA ligase
MALLAAALALLPCREAIIDGEVAAPDEHGVTRVTDVRGALRQPERLIYYASTCCGSTARICARCR